MTPLNPRNIKRHELIGLEAEVVKSSHPGFVGMRGIVVNETRGMLVLSHRSGQKSVPKCVSDFRFTLPNGSRVEVGGAEIQRRPEERLRRGR